MPYPTDFARFWLRAYQLQHGRITAARVNASAQSSSEADCHWEVTATKSKQSFFHESSTVVYDLTVPQRSQGMSLLWIISLVSGGRGGISTDPATVALTISPAENHIEELLV